MPCDASLSLSLSRLESQSTDSRHTISDQLSFAHALIEQFDFNRTIVQSK